MLNKSYEDIKKLNLILLKRSRCCLVKSKRIVRYLLYHMAPSFVTKQVLSFYKL